MEVIIKDVVFTGLKRNTRGLELKEKLEGFGFVGLWIYDDDLNSDIYYLNVNKLKINEMTLIELVKLTKQITIDIEISNGEIFVS